MLIIILSPKTTLFTLIKKNVFTIQSYYNGSLEQTQALWVLHQEGCLQAVREGDPGQVTEDQHEAKTIMDNIHSGQNSLLVNTLKEDGSIRKNQKKAETVLLEKVKRAAHLIPQSISYIKHLETVDQDHSEGGGSSKLHLLHQHPEVYDHLRRRE